MPDTSARAGVVFRRGVLAFAVLAGVLGAAAGFAADARELGERARQRFEVLPLREGVLLKPLAHADYAVIEITEHSVAVDGQELSSRALRRRLGDDAELVEDLADLDAAELRDVADGAAPASPSAVPAAPAPPAVPAPPMPPSLPTPPRAPRSRHADAKVSVASSAHVAAGETSDDVIVFGGNVLIDGEVHGDATAMGGEVTINGRVTGDVTAVGGGVELGPDSEVEGEVTSVGGHIHRAAGAKVGGRTSEVALGPLLSAGVLKNLGRHRTHVDFEPFEHVAGVFSAALRVVLLTLFGSLVLLLVRQPLERVADKVGDEVWRCGLTGLAAQVLVVPLFFITFVVLMVSVIGIPLVVLLPFAALAFIVGAFLGYTAVALRIGRWLERRFGWTVASPYLVLLVGVVCIQAATLVGRLLDWDVTPLGFFAMLLLFAGFVIQYVAWTVGLGAVLVTRFGTYAVWRGWRWHRPETLPATGPLVPPPPPPPPAAVVIEPPASDVEADGETKPGA